MEPLIEALFNFLTQPWRDQYMYVRHLINVHALNSAGGSKTHRAVGTSPTCSQNPPVRSEQIHAEVKVGSK